MKKLILLVLICLSSLVFAQENLVGYWTFNDSQDLLKANVGPNLTLVGSHTQVKDANEKDEAISIGVGNYYILPHGLAATGGGTNVNEYTLVMDVLLPQLGHWFTLFQTDQNNVNDGEVFFNPTGLIGVGATGYAGAPVEAGKWYRVAIAVKNGISHEYYIDGKLALAGSPGPIDGRFSLAPTVLLFADENGEDNLIHVNEIKLFSSALSASEITELGGYNNYIANPPNPNSPPFIPYLQSPSPTSIYVCWHDATTTESVVEYGTTEALGQTQSGTIHEFDSNTIWHWSNLTQLTPETVYYYKIKSNTINTDVFQFKTPPVDGANSGHIRFSVVGDNRTEPDVFKRTMDKMKEKMIELYGENVVDSVNLVLNVGDIVTNGFNLSEYTREFFEPIAALSPTIPTMVSIGNHEREAPHYYNYMKYENVGGPQGEKYYSFQYGRALFVAINSNSGLRNSTQITWLDNVLNEAQQDTSIDWIVSFCHHPGRSELWPDGNTAYIQNSVIPTLNKYSKADILLYGHSHNYERGAVLDGNLRLMLNGGGGSALDRWRMYSNQTPYPEIQKSYDYYCYSIFDIDIAAKKMTVKSYSLGHTEKYMDNVIFDEFIRDKKNETPPAKPTLLQPENGGEIQTSAELKSAPFSGDFGFMSSQFQVSKIKGEYTSPVANSHRDFEDIYWDTGAPDYLPIDRNAGVDLTSYSLNLENVKPGTEFWWRVRYRDKNLQWSDWSDESSFVIADRRHYQEPNDSPETATEMFASDTLFAEFHNPSDVDWYFVNLNQLSIYYFSSFNSTPGVKPTLELYHENDHTLDLLQKSVNGLNDAEDFLLAGYLPFKTGTYLLKVNNSGNQLGQYGIRISGGRKASQMMNNEIDNTIVDVYSKAFLSESDTLSAAIFPVDDIDFFKIEGQQGQEFELGTVPVLDLGNRDTDTFISLLDSESNVLFENDNRGAIETTTGELQTNTFSILKGTFPQSGTFYLRVQSAYNSTNDTIDVRHSGIGEYGVYFQPGTVSFVGNKELKGPNNYDLFQNFPNPFNPSTTIRFSLTNKVSLEMRIYDTSGRTIKDLVSNTIMDAGIHEIIWDGTNESFNQTASGVYFCQLKSSDFNKTIKLILVH